MAETEVKEEKIEEAVEEVKEAEEKKIEEGQKVEKPRMVIRVGKKRGPGKIPRTVIEKEIISKKELEEGDVDERILTIRFYPRILSAPKWKRAKKAVKVLRELVIKYVKYFKDKKSGEKYRIRNPNVWISPKTNEIIWSRGAKNPPRRIRVRVLIKPVRKDTKNKMVDAELRVLPIQ